MKRRLKLAEIRKNEDSPCPFGLPIPFGCKYAGSCVKRMAPIDIMGKDVDDEEKKMIGSANTKLLSWSLLNSAEKPTPCIYAGHIMEEKDVVECNFEDSAPGEGPGQALLGAPFYSKIFSGGFTGLYTYPVGFYSDYNVSRNLFFGVNSIMGEVIFDLIKKGS